MSNRDPFRGGPRSFTTSHWSLILTAGTEDAGAARSAFEKLFRQYSYPLYAYARRRGYDHDSGQDLTQSFFVYLLEKGCLKAADPRRGRFRTFILSSFRNFLSNEWDRSTAMKRGGGKPILPLDGASERFRVDPHDLAAPEQAFDREWALSLIRKALDNLQREMAATGGADRFAVLKVFLLGETPLKSYREVGEDLGLTEGAVKVAVHRMRRRLGASLRDEIAQTVQDASMIDDELRYLMEALGH